MGVPYEFPNHTVSVRVIGAIPYSRGPSVWDDALNSSEPFDTYGKSTGWAFNLAKNDAKTGRCPPIPDDAWGRRLKSGGEVWVQDAKGQASGGCFVGCNMSEIENGKPDPCNAGSIQVDTPRFGPVLANFSCFYGGPGWLPDGVGQCGFNCTAFDIYNKTPCNVWEANPPPGKKASCAVVCNPAKF